jgi:hypothetical protein
MQMQDAKFRASVEKQSGQPMKCLSSDNEEEYVGKDFVKYLLENGISWHRFVPYTPQHNGIAERKNQTLVEMAHCLLQAKCLSTKFWAKAIYCSNYLLNLILTKVVCDVTLIEK